MDAKQYVDETHLVEEVPGVEEYRYFLWHDHKTVWRGMTRDAGYEYARQNGITIEAFYPFCP